MPKVDIRVKKVFIKHGKGLRPYPFSLVEIIDITTNEILACGMAPDNEMVKQPDYGVKEEFETPQIHHSFEIDPLWAYKKELATGIMYDSGQF
jgi:hypothetical protein